MAGVTQKRMQRFEGAAYLRYRLVLSLLSTAPVRFDKIRADDSTAPGLCPSEISFIRLLDKLTSGTKVHINDTGTTLIFHPGILCGSQTGLTHVCHPSRGVAYYAEPLLLLAPFFKRALRIVLTGSTHSICDISADTLSTVSAPLLRRVTRPHSLSPGIAVRRRAIAGGTGGEISLTCGVATGKLAPVDLVETGFVKRIRGVAFANRTSPALISRMVDTVRGILNRFTPDVYIHTDHSNGNNCGTGFGLHLIAETTEGCLIGADWASDSPNVTPEKVAQTAVNLLLEEIQHGGCVDSNSAPMALLYCALTDCDVSRVRVGRLSEATVQFLRDMRTFFGIVFKVKVENEEEDMESESGSDSDSQSAKGQEESDREKQENKLGRRRRKTKERGVVFSCVGLGHSNTARQRF